MSFYTKLDNLNLEELIAHFKKQPIYKDDDTLLYYQEVALLIQQKGEEGIAFLLGEINQADTARLVGILFAISFPAPNNPEIGDLVLSYIQDLRPTIVAEAIDGLRHLGKKDALDRVLPLLEHSSPGVKGSVLRYMAKLYPERSLPLLIKSLKHPHFIVRENAADELGELDLVEAIPYLQTLLADSHPDVRQAAKTAIEMIEGTFLG